MRGSLPAIDRDVVFPDGFVATEGDKIQDVGEMAKLSLHPHLAGGTQIDLSGKTDHSRSGQCSYPLYHAPKPWSGHLAPRYGYGIVSCGSNMSQLSPRRGDLSERHGTQ